MSALFQQAKVTRITARTIVFLIFDHHSTKIRPNNVIHSSAPLCRPSTQSSNACRNRSNYAHMNKHRGFTLIELMVVIAIVAILTTLAAPSFKAMIQSSNMTSTVNTFLADMRFARSESIRRGGGVVMCPSANSESSAASCTGSSGWEGGWIIFQDLNNTNTRTANEPILRVQGPITAVNTIEAFSSTTFQFTATGRLSLASATHLTFGSPPIYGTPAQRVICIGMGGRARIAIDSEGKPTGNATCSADQ